MILGFFSCVCFRPIVWFIVVVLPAHASSAWELDSLSFGDIIAGNIKSLRVKGADLVAFFVFIVDFWSELSFNDSLMMVSSQGELHGMSGTVYQ